MELLRRLELYDRTMIIVTSDHGEELYDHEGWGHAHALYNESIKAPLVIKFPRGRFSGRRVESFVRSIDIMPTILEISGVGFSRDTFDGRSLIPLVKGEENKDRTFFSEIRYEEDIPDRVSSNLERMKLILNGSYTDEQLRTFLSPPPTKEREELFDLKADRNERSNIRPDERAAFGKIAAQIVRYQRQAKTKERHIDNRAVDERVREQLRALGYIK
jgi:arylsulfatase A-like enzyme